MRHLFLSPAQLEGASVTIDGADAHHLINVVRIRAGEKLTLLDNRGAGYLAEVTEVAKRSVLARKLGPAELLPEPRLHITVAQALGKGDKFEQVVQHGVEVGASAFIPLQTERAVVKLDSKSAADKREKWAAIARGAAEQAHRARVPEVGPVSSVRDLAGRFRDYGAALMLHPEGEPLAEMAASLPVALSPCLLLVGPEGGFAPSELELAAEAGARIVRLGDHVLRTETAALAGVCYLLAIAQSARAHR